MNNTQYKQTSHKTIPPDSLELNRQ